MGGYWSAYWFGGLIYGTEIARGLDVLALTPSEHLTGNEIAAASLYDPDALFNPQTQTRHVWPAEPVVARAYLDQLGRSDAVETASAEELTAALDRAEDALSGGEREPGTAEMLESLAETMARDGAERSGATQVRFLALAETLEGLADRLR